MGKPLLVRLGGGHRGEHAFAARAGRRAVECGEVINCGRYGGKVGVRRGAGLEPLGHRARRGCELVRVQGVEQARIGDNGADMRPGPFVSARGEEVGAERCHIDRAVRRGVHAIHVGKSAGVVRLRRDGCHVRPVPSTLLAAVTATSRVRPDSR